jgi:predicted nucleic acid-binding protein
MPNKPLILYWDSCAFIHLFQGKNVEYTVALQDQIERARKGECEIATSAVSLAEVCKLPDLGVLPIEQTQKILAFFGNDYIHVWQADRSICEDAHHVIREHGLLPMDAIHVATALASKAEIMITTESKKYRRRSLFLHDQKIHSLHQPDAPPLKIQIPNVKMFLPLL